MDGAITALGEAAVKPPGAVTDNVKAGFIPVDTEQILNKTI